MNSSNNNSTQEDKVISYLSLKTGDNTKYNYLCPNCIAKSSKLLKKIYQTKSCYFCNSCASLLNDIELQRKLIELTLINYQVKFGTIWQNKKFSDSNVSRIYEITNRTDERGAPSGSISNHRVNDSQNRIKLSKHKKLWVQKRFTKYAEQIGISDEDIPNVIFTRKEVLALPKELTAGRRTVTHKCFGICFSRAKTIFINVKNHRTLPDMEHTIVHELVHYRFRYLKHGEKFENRINLILNKGKRYPVRKLYLHNSAIPLRSEKHEYKTAAIT